MMLYSKWVGSAKEGVVRPSSVSSSVVFDLRSPLPMSSTPRGEAQAVWPIRCCPRVCVSFQLPAVNVIHDLLQQMRRPL